MDYTILAINPGSTSTKLGLYQNDACLLEESTPFHMPVKPEKVHVLDEFNPRMDTIRAFLRRAGRTPEEIDLFVSRAGAPCPVEYGAYTIDRRMARALLAECGIGEGELNFYTVVSANDTNSSTLAELVQSYLSDVGIGLKIDTFDFPTALQMQRNGSVDLCITTFYTSNNDISGCLVQILEGSYNQAAWLTQLDEELAAKVEAGRHTDSAETAASIYGWVQDWLHENMWFIPIVEYKAGFVCRDYVDASQFFDLMHSNDIRNLRLAEDA